MAAPVTMPDLGRIMAAGTLAEWLKRPGDAVAEGEAVAVVESDKATFEIEAGAAGILLAITVPAGRAVPPGTTLAWIGVPGEAPGTGPEAVPPAAMASVSRDIAVAANGPLTTRLALAAVHALRTEPALNARLADGAVRVDERIDLAVAVDTPAGLAWPVIHDAGNLPPATLAEAVAQCIGGAREGWLKPGPSDATFALLDLGPAGADAVTPALAAPRLAVLATGAPRRAAVETAGGIAFADRLTATLAVDSRLADEAAAARFLAALAAALGQV